MENNSKMERPNIQTKIPSDSDIYMRERQMKKDELLQMIWSAKAQDILKKSEQRLAADR